MYHTSIVRGAPPLTSDRLRSLGLTLSKFTAGGDVVPGFQPGPFALSVRALGVYGGAVDAPAS